MNADNNPDAGFAVVANSLNAYLEQTDRHDQSITRERITFTWARRDRERFGQ